MNFGDVKQRVRDSLGAISGEIDTQVANFIEDAIRDIHAHSRWVWDRDRLTFTARADVVGTGTWTRGTTSITLDTGNVASQSLADEYVGGLIKLNGANIYEISAWNQSTGVITTDSEIIDADGSATALQIIQDTVTLDSDVDSVIDVTDYLFPRILAKRTGHTKRRYWPDPFQEIGALPYEWWTRGVDSAGDVRLMIYPPPDADRTYELEYWKRPRFPSSDGDEMEAATGIPEKFHPVIVDGAKFYAFEFEFENEATKATAFAKFSRGLDRMRENSRLNAGAPRVLRSDRARVRDPFGRQTEYWPTDRITGV